MTADRDGQPVSSQEHSVSRHEHAANRRGDTASSLRHPLHAEAPANLLLMGEYAVLEPGGLGLACAPAYTTRGTFEPESPPGVTGIMGSAEQHWPGDHGILGGVADWLVERYGMPTGRITVDSSALYRRDGRKRGFGSSATLAVVLTALWLRLTSGDPPDQQLVLREAVAAHRSAQGGRGSGYDIATSTQGGLVLFHGGVHPRAERVELPWLPPLSLFSGAAAVATQGAVGRYREWAARAEKRASRFLTRSNELITAFVESGSWHEARPCLQEYTRLTRELGDEIGVSARLEPPAELTSGARERNPVWKAVGAGNELGVVFHDGGEVFHDGGEVFHDGGEVFHDGGEPGDRDATGDTASPEQLTPEQLTPVSIDREGLRWPESPWE